MPIMYQLRWIVPPNAGRPGLRVLTDEEGEENYALLELDVPHDMVKDAIPGQWLRGYSVPTADSAMKQSLPTMSLTGGDGTVVARVSFAPGTWHLFGGLTLPPPC